MAPPSGSEKRKLKKKRQANIDQLKGSIDKFVSSTVTTAVAATCDSDSVLESGSKSETIDLVNNNSSSSSIVHNKNEEEENADICAAREPSSLKNYVFDVGLWPHVITEEIREHFTFHKVPQNVEKISDSKRLIGSKERCLQSNHFFRKKRNNELVNREWLVYSPSKKALFCYVCKLFSNSDQALCKSGFSYWKNTSERLQEHENSSVHRNSVLCLSKRLKCSSRIDSVLVEEYQKECNYWRNVLLRVVASVKFLCQRGLALYGSDETLQSLRNGNFLGSIELISQFDPFTAEHLSKYGNPGTGKVNYLSSTIVSEVIEIMSQKVLNVIVAEVLKAKYFGLILDSTPDITHCDQLSIVLRYVDAMGEAKERFLKFERIHSHESSYLTDAVLLALDNFGIDIKNCRGQAYDNASNMSGKYSGLQTRIRALSPLALYVPCSAHSLNLVGQNSAECCEQAVSFFGLIQNIYVFFSSSTHRWEILTSKFEEKLTLKPLSTTRWSASADATRCIRLNYKNIMASLEEISVDCNEKAGTRHEAKSLFKKMSKFETAILSIVWDAVLQRINKVNKTLQSSTGNVSILIPLYDSLIKVIQTVRENFETYEHEASNLVDANYSVKRKRKIPKSRMLDDSLTEDTKFTNRTYFITQCHYTICDSLICELEKRKLAYEEIENRFGFLAKKSNEATIKMAAKCFLSSYKDDVDDNFEDEILQYLHFDSEENSSPVEKLKAIREQNIIHTFPNVDTALQILLTMPISNCTSERSFSALKRIKNRLRSATKQEQLSSLSILTIESDLTTALDFDDVINTFAANKARKKPFEV